MTDGRDQDGEPMFEDETPETQMGGVTRSPSSHAPHNGCEKWTDDDIREYINDLDKDETIELSDWEARFVESNLDRTHFSVKQRDVINKMLQKYGDEYA